MNNKLRLKNLCILSEYGSKKYSHFPYKKPIHLRLFSPSSNAAEAQAFAFSIPQKKRQLSIAILNANH